MILTVPDLGFLLQNDEAPRLAPAGIPCFYHSSDRMLLSDGCTEHTDEESLLTNKQITIFCLLNAERSLRCVCSQAVTLGQFTPSQATTFEFSPGRIYFKQNGA